MIANHKPVEVAYFVESLDDSIAQYEQLGYPLAARANAKLGTEFAFIDTRKLLGHMLEIYVDDETLTGFYRAPLNNGGSAQRAPQTSRCKAHFAANGLSP